MIRNLVRAVAAGVAVTVLVLGLGAPAGSDPLLNPDGVGCCSE